MKLLAPQDALSKGGDRSTAVNSESLGQKSESIRFSEVMTQGQSEGLTVGPAKKRKKRRIRFADDESTGLITGEDKKVGIFERLQIDPK